MAGYFKRCFLLLIAFSFSLIAQDTTSIDPVIEEEFFPPFEICIPDNFYIGWEQPSGVQEHVLLFREFVPEGEVVENWSQLITVQNIEGNVDIAQFLKQIKSSFEEMTKSGRILKSEITMRKEGIGVYLFDGSYESPMTDFKVSQTENQMVIIKAANGSDGSYWNVQYAIKYPKNLPKNKKSALTDKLWSFVDDCTPFNENSR